jgi:hypothetical protein
MVPRPPEVIQRFGLLEVIELRRPHLVLADLGGDVGVAALGQRVQPLDRVLRLDHVAFPGGRQAVARAPGSICFHQALSAVLVELAFGFQTAACLPARKPQSPTMAMSTRTFLLIEDGSMSMWIFFEPGEKASSGR